MVVFYGIPREAWAQFIRPLDRLGLAVGREFHVTYTRYLVMRLDGRRYARVPTGKILYLALVAGAAIVDASWVADSVAAGRVLPVGAYLAAGVATGPSEVAGTPRRALQAVQAGQRLFDRVAVVLALGLDGAPPHGDAAKAVLALVKLGGGIALQLRLGSTAAVEAVAGGDPATRLEQQVAAWWQQQQAPGGGSAWRRIVVVLGHCTRAQAAQLASEWRTRDVVTQSYILESVLTFTQQPPAGYRVGKPSACVTLAAPHN